MASEGVTLITPTGGRPKAFALCQKYVNRQTYSGPVQWVVVDDEETAKVNPFRSDAALTSVIFRKPWRVLGQTTLALNLLAALPEVAFEKILIIEDDDWYAPDYVETMARRLDDFDMIGESHSRYYHVPSRRWRVFENQQRSSLCQTGLRRSLLPDLRFVCESGADYVDVRLWQSVARKNIFDGRGCVGIKGLPGRTGIGIGHRPENDGSWASDPELKVFKHWVGEDVGLYEEFTR